MVNMHEGGMMPQTLVPLKIRGPHAPGVSLPLGADAPATPRASHTATETEGEHLVPLAKLEKDAIRTAIARFGDTAAGKEQAARALGIGIATLYRKLKSLTSE